MANTTIPKYADGNDSEWQELTNDETFSGKIYYRKIGNIVNVIGYNLSLKTALTGTNQGVTLYSGGIPEGYRPYDVVYCAGTASGATYAIAAQISTGGNIFFNCKMNNGFSTNQNFSFNFTYLV